MTKHKARHPRKFELDKKTAHGATNTMDGKETTQDR